jgi:hypothetical protein
MFNQFGLGKASNQYDVDDMISYDSCEHPMPRLAQAILEHSMPQATLVPALFS